MYLCHTVRHKVLVWTLTQNGRNVDNDTVDLLEVRHGQLGQCHYRLQVKVQHMVQSLKKLRIVNGTEGTTYVLKKGYLNDESIISNLRHC